MKIGRYGARRGPIAFLLAIVVLLTLVWGWLWLFQSRPLSTDERVRAIGAQLKCPICQGESVADSPSWLAKDMRDSIRQQVQQGKSDQEVLQYFEQRYGPEIIWAPRIQGITLLAWIVPLLLLLSGIVLLFFIVRDWRGSALAQMAPASPAQIETDPYREQIEHELAEEDILFSKPIAREEKK